jgi:exonuclease III
MSLVSWNYRGLGNPQTVRDIHLMVNEKQPNLLFLMETKVQNSTMQKICASIGFKGMLTMEQVGRSRGLAFLWKDNREVMIQNYSLRHINAIVSLLGSDYSWKLTGFYGNPNSAL